MKYQVAIIGGGPAGYTAAETAGKAGLSVVLFEKRNLGGVCLNEGCIPTKTLLYSAKTYDNACHASKYAVSVSEVSFDLSKIIARKQKVVRKLVLGVKLMSAIIYCSAQVRKHLFRPFPEWIRCLTGRIAMRWTIRSFQSRWPLSAVG